MYMLSVNSYVYIPSGNSSSYGYIPFAFGDVYVPSVNSYSYCTVA